jgi:hypothetical protein
MDNMCHIIHWLINDKVIKVEVDQINDKYQHANNKQCSDVYVYWNIMKVIA